MNYRMIVKRLGTVLLIEAACMVPALIVSLINSQGDFLSFIIAIAVIALLGFLMQSIKIGSNDIYIREGFAIVALSWILVSVLGALPYIISGAIPSVFDALFESVSGFTTTGASIINNIESVPKGILFWRSFTNWMGGMGVLVLLIAVLPSVKGNTLFILKAETTGPSPNKLVPKIRETAKILYLIYILLTFLEVILLLFGGMSLFDALIHSFGTAGTGGFSNKTLSVGDFNSLYIEIVIAVFMFLFGINFTLFFALIKGSLKSIFRDEELRFYTGTVIISIILISLNTFGTIYNSLGETLRYSFFQVCSMITTTGFATADFNLWPLFSQIILILLMFIGATAGSTGGGLKCIRILILFKVVKRELTKIIHPRAVNVITFNGKKLEEDNVYSILMYLAITFIIMLAGLLLISFDGKDSLTTLTSVFSAINNIGPGLGAVGPAGNFSGFSDFSKSVLSLLMLFGRLEIYPMLMLILPRFWRKQNI